MWENEDDEDVYLDGLCISNNFHVSAGPFSVNVLQRIPDTQISRYDLENV